VNLLRPLFGNPPRLQQPKHLAEVWAGRAKIPPGWIWRLYLGLILIPGGIGVAARALRLWIRPGTPSAWYDWVLCGGLGLLMAMVLHGFILLEMHGPRLIEIRGRGRWRRVVMLLSGGWSVPPKKVRRIVLAPEPGRTDCYRLTIFFGRGLSGSRRERRWSMLVCDPEAAWLFLKDLGVPLEGFEIILFA
jgi:hypothetical protein